MPILFLLADDDNEKPVRMFETSASATRYLEASLHQIYASNAGDLEVAFRVSAWLAAKPALVEELPRPLVLPKELWFEGDKITTHLVSVIPSSRWAERFDNLQIKHVWKIVTVFSPEAAWPWGERLLEVTVEDSYGSPS